MSSSPSQPTASTRAAPRSSSMDSRSPRKTIVTVSHKSRKKKYLRKLSAKSTNTKTAPSSARSSRAPTRKKSRKENVHPASAKSSSAKPKPCGRNTSPKKKPPPPNQKSIRSASTFRRYKRSPIPRPQNPVITLPDESVGVA